MNAAIFINILLFFCMYPVLFILYFVYKNESTPKQHHLFGIRYSEEWLSEAEIKDLQESYCRKMRHYLLVLALAPFSTLLIPYFSIAIAIWMIWIFSAIVLFLAPYAAGNKTMLRLKQERTHVTEKNGTNYTEMKAAGTVRTVKWYDFAPATAASLLLAAASLFCLHGQRFETYSFIIIMFAACTPVFHLLALWIDRTKTKVISTDSTVNVNYSRSAKLLWKHFIMACTWCNTLFTAVLLSVVLTVSDGSDLPFHIILWGSIAMCLCVLGLVWRLWKRKAALDRSYEDKRDLDDSGDERNWIWGIFYYNPKDSHTLVSKPVGVGSTCNLATPAGKASMIFSALCLLIVPVSIIWCMLLEFTPISLTIQNDALCATQIRRDYDIPENSIDNIVLLDQYPESRRTRGTGMDNLLKGTFRNSTDGTVEFFLNPQNHLFLRIEADGTIYYFSGYDDAETRAVYEELMR